MKTHILRAALWSFVVIYVAMIFTGSVFARALAETVKDLTGSSLGVLVKYLCGAAGLASALWMAVFKKERNPERYFVLLLIGTAFISILLNLNNPDEKIHVAEFALLGGVVFLALKLDLPVHGRALYLLAFLICGAVGILDEVVQSFVPDRVCDPRDMVVNVISSLLAIQAMRVFVGHRKAQSA